MKKLSQQELYLSILRLNLANKAWLYAYKFN